MKRTNNARSGRWNALLRGMRMMMLAGVMAFSACQDEETTGVEDKASKGAFTLTATMGAATKTTLGGADHRQVYWSADDAIGVYIVYEGEEEGAAGNQPTRFTASEANGTSSSALFTGDLSGIGDGNYTIYAVYPYDENANFGSQSFDFTTVTTSGTAIAPMWAKAENVTFANGQPATNIHLQFQHLTTLLEFDITNSTGAELAIGSITLRSGAESIPLKATLNAQTGEWTRESVTYPGELTLAPTDNITVAASGTVKAWLPFIPGTVTGEGTEAVYETAGKGMSVTVKTSAGKTYTVAKHGIAFEAGKCYTVNVPLSQPGNGKASIETVLIEAAGKSFIMGSPTDETGHSSNETQHQVSFTKNFYMSRYEITNAQYCEFLNDAGVGDDGKYTFAGTNASFGEQTLISDCSGTSYAWGVTYNTTNSKWEPVSGYENYPVIYVTWYGATAYAGWAGGSLPTEAQWEYACRAGSETAYCYGDDASGLADYGWYSGNSGSKTHPVGGKLPNAWGLYDMHGNVWEWCSDWYAVDNTTVTDGDTGNTTASSYRVNRGGGWHINASSCRSAYRNYNLPTNSNSHYGFRVLFSL